MLIWVQRYNIFLYKGRKVVRYFLYRGNFSEKLSSIKETFFKLPQAVSPNQSPVIRAKRSFQDTEYSPLYALCSRKGTGN